MSGRSLDLSVIVVVYNQAESLKLILRSLLAQDFSGSYEIIVTDDGSSPELFLTCREDFNKSSIPIKYVWQQDRHFRAAAARNNGINISNGKILLFLDGDLVPALDALRKHVELHTSPKMMVAGNRKWRGELANAEHLLTKPIKEAIKFLEDILPVDEKSRQREEVERQRRKQWLASPYPWRACFSSNVSIGWSHEVRFDENFIGWGPEDWEFTYRLCMVHGYRPVYNEEIVAYHLESIISKPLLTGQHEDIVRLLRNTCYFYDKYPTLKLEDVFFWFPRFRLNQHSGQWEVIPRPNSASYNLEEIVVQVRSWLLENGIYP